MCIEIIKYAHINPYDMATLRLFRIDVKKRLYLLSYDSIKKREDNLRTHKRSFPLLLIEDHIINAFEDSASNVISLQSNMVIR